MQFVMLNEVEKRDYYDQLLAVLTEVDREFVPALSDREPMVLPGMELQEGEKLTGSVRAYLDEMLVMEKILAVLEEDSVIGLVSFIEDERFEILTEADLPNIYVCTVAVSPTARGKGITKKVYNHLFNMIYPQRNIFTRTWSTNLAHTKILLAMGFREFKRIPNDRGVGIDTVYYENRRL